MTKIEYCGTNAPAISTLPFSPGARGANSSVGAPDRQGNVLHDQHDAEGRQQLKNFRRRVKAPKQNDFDQCTDRRDRERRQQQAAEKIERSSMSSCVVIV